MIAAANGLSRLDLAYTFRTATSRNHDGKSLFEPIRKTDVSQRRKPTLQVRVRQLMRQDGRQTLALSGEQNRRQDHVAEKRHPSGAGISNSVCSREGLPRDVHADGDRMSKLALLDGLDPSDGGWRSEERRVGKE